VARAFAVSPVLLSLLGIGVACGAAATFVVSSTVPYVAGDPVNTTIPSSIVILILLFPFLWIMGWAIYKRVTGGSARLASKGGFVALFFILAIMIVIGILAGVLGSHPEYYFSGHGTNPGGNNTPPGNQNKTNLTPPLPSGNLTPAIFHVVSLPPWAVLVAAASIGLAVVGLAIPSYGQWSARRRARRKATLGPAERAEASAALSEALTDLDRGSNPRQVIERLYTRFLDRVAPMSVDLEVRTPEEIRTDTLLPLGVRPAAAVQLTRVFEESRYSSHPMNAEQVASVREAIRLAASDLTRYAPPS